MSHNIGPQNFFPPFGHHPPIGFQMTPFETQPCERVRVAKLEEENAALKAENARLRAELINAETLLNALKKSKPTLDNKHIKLDEK